MRQRERRLRDSKRWNYVQWWGGGVQRLFLWCRFLEGMRECKTCTSLQGAVPTNEAIIWQICKSLHWGRLGVGWAERKLGLGKRIGWWWGVGRGHELIETSVISRRPVAARGHRGAHWSRGMIEQTTPTTLAGGPRVWTNQSGKK